MLEALPEDVMNDFAKQIKKYNPSCFLGRIFTFNNKKYYVVATDLRHNASLYTLEYCILRMIKQESLEDDELYIIVIPYMTNTKKILALREIQ